MKPLIACLALLMAFIAHAGPSAPSENKQVTAARLNAQLAIAYITQNDVVAAQEKIDKALSQNPHDGTVQTAAAHVYERLQQIEKADHHYAEALKMEPRNADFQNGYAVFLCRHGHYAEGQKMFEVAAKNPSYASPEIAYSNSGVCARSANDFPRAEEMFQAALRERADYPDALLQLADLTFTRGAMLDSRALLDRYFKSSEPTAEALLIGVRVERALGDKVAAARYAGQLRRDFPNSEQAQALRAGATP